jgi:hypothetical protein
MEDEPKQWMEQEGGLNKKEDGTRWRMEQEGGRNNWEHSAHSALSEGAPCVLTAQRGGGNRSLGRKLKICYSKLYAPAPPPHTSIESEAGLLGSLVLCARIQEIYAFIICPPSKG